MNFCDTSIFRTKNWATSFKNYLLVLISVNQTTVIKGLITLMTQARTGQVTLDSNYQGVVVVPLDH